MKLTGREKVYIQKIEHNILKCPEKYLNSGNKNHYL